MNLPQETQSLKMIGNTKMISVWTSELYKRFSIPKETKNDHLYDGWSSSGADFSKLSEFVVCCQIITFGHMLAATLRDTIGSMWHIWIFQKVCSLWTPEWQQHIFTWKKNYAILTLGVFTWWRNESKHICQGWMIPVIAVLIHTVAICWFSWLKLNLHK